MQIAWEVCVCRCSATVILPHGSVPLHLVYLLWAAVILTPFSPLPPLPSTLLLFLGRCCQAYCRSIAVYYQRGTQVRTRQTVTVSTKHTGHTHTQCWDRGREPVTGSKEWVVVLGTDAQWVGHICLPVFVCSVHYTTFAGWAFLLSVFFFLCVVTHLLLPAEQVHFISVILTVHLLFLVAGM